jgi:repressor of nif and glnA expression
MLRLEQFRAEVLERLERLDRRCAQIELRVGRIEQRGDDLSERVLRLHLDLIDRVPNLEPDEP